MATNPIQRRSRQSFLIGFLIALIFMAVIVVLLFLKISSLNEELETTQELIPTEKTVYVAITDIKSGDKITSDFFVPKKVKTDTDLSLYLTPADFEYNEDGSPIEYTAKVDIPYDSMALTSMIVKSGEERRDDERIMEYNMIVLPTQLRNGNYIDVRLMMPSGEDYIVLSKKYVTQTTETNIWIEMTEEEILSLNSAIVDAYITDGTKLYATIYTEPGMQEKAEPTYPVNNRILDLIAKDPNIIDDAKNELAKRWLADTNGDGITDFMEERNEINSNTSNLTEDSKSSKVESGITTETSALNSSRSEYVSSLEGTGLVGIITY